jgi:NTP pyrophosphatase (non-canonical NTP hydrolase)
MSNIDEYQEKAASFRVPTATPEERVFGLLSEAGEVAGVFQRMFRGDYAPDEAGTRLAKELGDILWYAANIATDNGWKLSEILQTNVEKLESRKLRNVIIGAGDDR